MPVDWIQKKSQSVIEFSFLAIFFITPFLFTPFNSEIFEFNKMLFVYGAATIIVGSWAVKSILAGKLIFKRTFLDIPLILFLASQVLSTIFSIDRHVSIWGYYSRSHGGLLSTISYLLLYWAFVSNLNKENIQKIIKSSLVSASIISIYAILEHFGVSPSCLIIQQEIGVDCWVQDVQSRVFATLGQPNWLAAWLVAVMPLAWYKLVQSKVGDKGFYFSASILMFSALLFTKSRSGILGFVVAFMIFSTLSLLTIHNLRLTLKKPLLLLTILYSLLTILVGTPWTPNYASLLREGASSEQAPNPIDKKLTVGTSLENGGTESGDIRKIVWKGSVDIWRAYPMFGSGVETFAFSYYNFRPVEHNQTSEWDFLYNKAHNEYLNFAATTGSFGLAAYLIVIASFVLWSIFRIFNFQFSIFNQFQSNRSQFSNLHLAVLSGFSSILVTNFFGFSTVSIALLFFLYPALAVNSKKRIENSSSKSEINIRKIIVILIFSLLTIYFLLRIMLLWLSDYHYAQSQKQNKQGFHISALRNIQKSISFRPNEPVYYDQLAQTSTYIATNLVDQDKLSEAKSAAKLALDASDFTLSVSPRSLSFIKSRVTILNRLASVDESYLAQAVLYLERAVELAPTDPRVRYNLGALYSKMGDNAKARQILEQSLSLKPNYEDAIKGLEEINK